MLLLKGVVTSKVQRASGSATYLIIGRTAESDLLFAFSKLSLTLNVKVGWRREKQTREVANLVLSL